MLTNLHVPSIFLILAIFTCSCKAYRNPNKLHSKNTIESQILRGEIPGLQNLVVGDKIKVVAEDKRVMFMIYQGLQSDFILGELYKQDGKKLTESQNIQVPLTEINYLRVRRKSLGATVAWTLGLGTVTAIALIPVLADLYGELGPDDQ